MGVKKDSEVEKEGEEEEEEEEKQQQQQQQQPQPKVKAGKVGLSKKERKKEKKEKEKEKRERKEKRRSSAESKSSSSKKSESVGSQAAEGGLSPSEKNDSVKVEPDDSVFVQYPTIATPDLEKEEEDSQIRARERNVSCALDDNVNAEEVASNDKAQVVVETAPENKEDEFFRVCADEIYKELDLGLDVIVGSLDAARDQAVGDDAAEVENPTNDVADTPEEDHGRSKPADEECPDVDQGATSGIPDQSTGKIHDPFQEAPPSCTEASTTESLKAKRNLIAQSLFQECHSVDFPSSAQLGSASQMGNAPLGELSTPTEQVRCGDLSLRLLLVPQTVSIYHEIELNVLFSICQSTFSLLNPTVPEFLPAVRSSEKKYNVPHHADIRPHSQAALLDLKVRLGCFHDNK